MKKQNLLYIGTLFCFICFTILISDESRDPFMWLEEHSDKVNQWVQTKNETTISDLQSQPEFQTINNKVLEILNSQEKLAYPSMRGDYIYNHWKDDEHQRGLLRRVPHEEFFKQPISWETVIDFDALSAQENENWAYKGAVYLYPRYDRCMIRLSRGGSDAVETREFDLQKKSFVDNGFFLPEAKSFVSWVDSSTLLVQTDFGEGTTTTSGYPRMVKRWKRGVPLENAETLFEGQKTDVGMWASVFNTPERQYIMITRGITFYTSEFYMVENDRLTKLDIPEDANVSGFFKNQMIIRLKSDWTLQENTYQQGALISVDYDDFLRGQRNVEIIFNPTERMSLGRVSITKNCILLTTLKNIVSELHSYSRPGGEWIQTKIDIPDLSTIWVIDSDQFSEKYFYVFENFLNPSSLYYVPGKQLKAKRVKTEPHFFNSDNLQVDQYQVASKDGTQIPYFIVSSNQTKRDGSNPTLLYGYGGFMSSLVPYYNAVLGVSWLEKGGIYVHANIRGGGEFGPQWHQAALKEKRQNAYDDFIAVAEDLIARNITSPKHLGIMGGSNGGLLVGVAFTQRPDLFNAVVCAAPLLDMKRYTKLPPGASWIAEYGDPDIPEQWEYIKKYSPYHNVNATAKYPKVLFTTTSRDDRVHPAHARKMVAKMENQGHDVYYFENTEGGHGAGVTNEQRALMTSLEYTYLSKMLMKD